MSGGIAYIYDPERRFKVRCNPEMVELETVETDADAKELHELISNHQRYTNSTVAADILEKWEDSLANFVKVMPTDYKRVLNEQQSVSAG